MVQIAQFKAHIFQNELDTVVKIEMQSLEQCSSENCQIYEKRGRDHACREKSHCGLVVSAPA